MSQPGPRTGPDPQAVLFDFDGTLVDSYPAITASVNHVRADHRLPPLDEAEVRRHVGRGPAYLLEHTVPGTDLARDLARYRAHHPSVFRTGTRLLPGALDTLRALKAGGRQTAVCSNKPKRFTLELLAFLELDLLVDVALGPEDVARPKPAPDMLRAALARLRCAPGEALYVGDMVVDIETARAAGIPVWVVATGSDDRLALLAASPDRLLEGLREIPDLLRARAGRL
jgi:phosphoglycolate phosphatase